MMNRAGYYKINLSGAMQYQSFVPNKLPPNPYLEFDDELINLLTKANRNIAVLEILSQYIPNYNLFIYMHVRKETLISSQIEGTQATLEDILDPTTEVNANQDVEEVLHYVNATWYAINRLKTLPLCNRLIRESHAILMKGVRGQDKNPGEFRRSQNWIGGLGSTISNAKYISPSVDDMITAVSDLEKFINAEDQIDVLIKAALIHYQFETIHPFLDGNGRIGRLLIILFLIDKKCISTPLLYISYYLKRNRIEYYDRMTEVRQSGNYEQWIKFFLRALNESAQDAIRTIPQLDDLHNINMSKINKWKRAKTTASKLLEYLEKSPIIDIGKTAKDLHLSFGTVSSAVKRFIQEGILVQTENIRRNRLFVYEKYLKILKQGT